MEHINHLEKTTSAQSFEDVIVIQPDGEKKIKSNCKNCNIIIIQNPFSMWRHWKYSCPFKCLFKYNNPTVNLNRIECDMTVTCLVCQKSFNDKTMRFMLTHRDQCPEVQTSPPVAMTFGRIPNNGLISTSENQRNSQSCAQIESENSDMQATNENEVTGSDQGSIEITNISDDEGSEQCCKICKSSFANESENLMKICFQCENRQLEAIRLVYEPEVLITVQTVHIENMNNLSLPAANLDGASPFIQYEDGTQTCFLCNNKNCESLQDLYTTVTKHSKKSINHFISKFLGGNSSVRNDIVDHSHSNDDVICNKCLEMINEYDKSREIAKQCKKQLSERLKKTEASLKETGSDNTDNSQQIDTFYELDSENDNNVSNTDPIDSNYAKEIPFFRY